MAQSEKQVPICSPDAFDYKVGFKDRTPDMESSTNSAQARSEESSEKKSGLKYFVSRLGKCGKFVWKLTTSHLGLLILLVAYSFLGAAIFNAVEYRDPETLIQDNATLVNLTKLANESEVRSSFAEMMKDSDFTSMSNDDLENMLQRYEETLNSYRAYKKAQSIDYWSWLLFCITVYTTIGYGHIAPSTRLGRAVTMAYATIGVPLFLMAMGKVGKLLTRSLKLLWSGLRKCYYSKHLQCIRKTRAVQSVQGGITTFVEKTNLKSSSSASGSNSSVRQSKENMETLHNGLDQPKDGPDNISYVSFEIDDEFDIHPLIAVFITALYIVMGAIMYIRWEKEWNYHDAFYFIFISVSTIGFGDLVPEHPKFFILSSIYILFGLALVAMVINVLIEFFTETIAQVKEHIHQVPELFKDREEDLSCTDLKAGIAMMHNLQGDSSLEGTPKARRISLP